MLQYAYNLGQIEFLCISLIYTNNSLWEVDGCVPIPESRTTIRSQSALSRECLAYVYERTSQQYISGVITTPERMYQQLRKLPVNFSIAVIMQIQSRMHTSLIDLDQYFNINITISTLINIFQLNKLLDVRSAVFVSIVGIDILQFFQKN